MNEESAAVLNESTALKLTNTRKVGPKTIWSEAVTDDLVDIICSSETYEKKIVFTNIKTAKNGVYCQRIVEELKRKGEDRKEACSFAIGLYREKFLGVS